MNQLNENMNVTYVDIHALIPHATNARTHSPKQIDQIANSIQEFGFNNPILIDQNNGIIAGHGRVLASEKLSLKSLPCLYLSHLSEAQKRAYIIADNKLAENAGWDQELLSLEMQYITDIDMDFDLTLTGFENAEIDALFQMEVLEGADPLDVPVEAPYNPVTNLGDLWVVGNHKILCGDSLSVESYQRLMGKEKARAVFTDPPYNVPVNGHICGLGKVSHEEFKMASGEMSAEEFRKFLSDIFLRLCAYTTDGSIHFICMDWRHAGDLIYAAEKNYSEYKNLCVWNKNNGGMGSLYRSKHELVFVYKNGKAPHINNVELGKHGRYRTNVWDYAGINTFTQNREESLGYHPTVKPTQMIADAICDVSKRGDIILDAFGGSGSTLLAAEKTNRKACLIELEPKYVDVTLERFLKMTGIEPTLEKCGTPYTELKKIREINDAG